MHILEYIEQKSELVNKKLEEFFPQNAKGVPLLRESMRYSLFAGGKRLRPVLCILGYELGGGKNEEEILPQACALEMIHTFTLIHDDLPAMDNDDFRRGKPTNHRVYGEAMAILAGDALFIEAVGLFLKGPLSAEVKVKMLSELVDALGVDGVIGGQVLDLRAEGKVHTQRLVENIHLRKTARFIEASIVIGAIGSGAKESVVEGLRIIGRKLGLLFQIVDDILDETAEDEELGKKARKDRERGKCTYPSVLGLEKSYDIARELVRDIKVEAKSLLGDKVKLIEGLADYFLSRRK
uniref:Polyprenyl synthetase family protein n=1 Tax=candidate division WOR-3 bacterium TaxID=2052148 RepID=A0A7V3ZXR4_UNCW3